MPSSGRTKREACSGIKVEVAALIEMPVWAEITEAAALARHDGRALGCEPALQFQDYRNSLHASVDAVESISMESEAEQIPERDQ
jgi:hypothetical protein